MSEGSYSLRVEKILSATPEMVFDAWLDQENIAQWLAPAEGVSVPSPNLDPVVGGSFDVTMKMGENLLPHFGQYKKIDRATELQFTWNSPHGTNGIDTLVTINFAPVDDSKTKLILVHDLLPTEEQRDNHEGGWSRILDCLFKFTSK